MKVQIEQPIEDDNTISLTALSEFVDAVKAASEGDWLHTVYIQVTPFALLFEKGNA